MNADRQAGRLCAALALVCLGWGASCEARTDPVEPDAGDLCDAAQARLRQLSCVEGDGSVGPDGHAGTEDDKSFAELCRDLEADFPGLADPVCIMEAVDCPAARACARE